MITSTSNPHIKAIRKLSDVNERAVTGNFLAEGLRVVGQAFESHAEIVEFIYSAELLISEYGQKLLEEAKNAEIPITPVSASVFESLARKDKPQGVAALIRQNWQHLSTFASLQSGILIALEAVQNPGNLGTILRTCDAVAAKGLILLDHSTDPYDPIAVKAAMGAIFTPLPTTGSEREGISDKYAQLCRSIVRIPMLGACDSLNLSVATGVTLYQVYHQHNIKA